MTVVLVVVDCCDVERVEDAAIDSSCSNLKYPFGGLSMVPINTSASTSSSIYTIIIRVLKAILSTTTTL